jgi:hypothetical protein
MIAAKLKWVDGKGGIGIGMSAEIEKEAFGLLDNSPEAVAVRRKELERQGIVPKVKRNNKWRA